MNFRRTPAEGPELFHPLPEYRLDSVGVRVLGVARILQCERINVAQHTFVHEAISRAQRSLLRNKGDLEILSGPRRQVIDDHLREDPMTAQWILVRTTL